MHSQTLHDHLRLLTAWKGTPALLCITGASGVGKTTVLAALRERIDPQLLPCLSFDSLGVPSRDEMIRCWESGRGWQKAMTYFWVQTARQIYRFRPLVILEGQFDPQYAIAACSANRMRHHVALLDVDAATRRERLARRGQPQAADDDQTAWAAALAENTRTLGGTIVDAAPPPDALAESLCGIALALVTASS